MSCVLCDILKNEETRIVHKDEHVFIALNFEPLKRGHLMVLPIQHVENLGELNPESSAAFLKEIDRAMNVLAAYSEETPICIVNGWKARTQPHLHAHVLPGKYDLRGLFVQSEGVPARMKVGVEELEEVCKKLKNLLR